MTYTPITPECHIWDEEGGPAFPASVPGSIAFKGMSLRDYFAGQALAGMHLFIGGYPKDMTTVAQTAYAYADAMLVVTTGTGDPMAEIDKDSVIATACTLEIYADDGRSLSKKDMLALAKLLRDLLAERDALAAEKKDRAEIFRQVLAKEAQSERRAAFLEAAEVAETQMDSDRECGVDPELVMTAMLTAKQIAAALRALAEKN